MYAMGGVGVQRWADRTKAAGRHRVKEKLIEQASGIKREDGHEGVGMIYAAI